MLSLCKTDQTLKARNSRAANEKTFSFYIELNDSCGACVGLDLCRLMIKGFLNRARDSEEWKDRFIPEWPAMLSCNRRLYRP